MHIAQPFDLLIRDLIVGGGDGEAICKCGEGRVDFARLSRRRNMARDLPDISFRDVVIASVAGDRVAAHEFERVKFFEAIADIAARDAELKL